MRGSMHEVGIESLQVGLKHVHVGVSNNAMQFRSPPCTETGMQLSIDRN